MVRRNVALVSGFWAQNIGNAFFNIGGLNILQNIFSHVEPAFIQDQPGYWTMNMRKNPKNSLDILSELDIEYLVLQGPVFSKTLRKLWNNTFKNIYRKNIKVIYIGSAFFKYTNEEIDDVRSFLTEFPPSIISTRDTESYNAIKDLAKYTYDGIDSAFFVPDAYKPLKLGSKYMVMNFDRFPEPNIIESSGNHKYEFEFQDKQYSLLFPKRLYKLSTQGKIMSYIADLFDNRILSDRLDDCMKIRTEHRFAPYIKHKIYKRNNSIVADEPYTYLTLYSGSQLTLSDRVHACVATLAYGNMAMLFSLSPRARIFDRLNVGDIRKKPVLLDSEYLQKEKESELHFLKYAINELK